MFGSQFYFKLSEHKFIHSKYSLVHMMVDAFFVRIFQL
uniref:Uncharacterized protein n=1 Tax=Rhizophora mucronata TaxID=61149 RepID=A0A2P2L1T8_RHIMU